MSWYRSLKEAYLTKEADDAKAPPSYMDIGHDPHSEWVLWVYRNGRIEEAVSDEESGKAIYHPSAFDKPYDAWGRIEYLTCRGSFSFYRGKGTSSKVILDAALAVLTKYPNIDFTAYDPKGIALPLKQLIRQLSAELNR
jgi:hypothetical protein